MDDDRQFLVAPREGVYLITYYGRSEARKTEVLMRTSIGDRIKIQASTASSRKNSPLTMTSLVELHPDKMVDFFVKSGAVSGSHITMARIASARWVFRQISSVFTSLFFLFPVSFLHYSVNYSSLRCEWAQLEIIPVLIIRKVQSTFTNLNERFLVVKSVVLLNKKNFCPFGRGKYFFKYIAGFLNKKTIIHSAGASIFLRI